MLKAPRMPFRGKQFSLGSGWGGPSWLPPKAEGSVLEVSAAEHRNREKGGAGDGWGLLFHFSRKDSCQVTSRWKVQDSQPVG